MIPTRDGTLLATDLYRPSAEGNFPVIIGRTPYGKGSSRHNYPIIAKMFASQGYAFLVQDVRGRYQSEGSFYAYKNEAMDGHDTVEWAGKAPWSNGRVALYGFSYLGSCVWLAATEPSPYLKTIVPLFTAQDTYQAWFDRGIPYLKDMVFWTTRYDGRMENPLTHEEVDKALLHFPVEEIDFVLNRRKISMYQDFLHQPLPGPFWEILSAHRKLAGIDLPILMYSGWYDTYLTSMLDDYRRMRTLNSSPVKLVIGPWVHSPVEEGRDLPFPENAHFLGEFKRMLRWFDRWLKEENQEEFNDSSITYFVMGINKWQNSDVWPPKNVTDHSFYLTKNGLNSKAENPSEEVTFSYDPQNPVPSIGTKMIYANKQEGPRKQNTLAEREDVVTLVSEPLDSDLEITGPIKLILFVSSTAEDTDFYAKLADVHPNGDSYFIQSGSIRMRYRNSLDGPDWMTPGKVYEIEIPMSATSNVFRKGHRIQLLITSSDFPYHDRNLNTREIPEIGKESKIAEQTIYLGKEFPSRLVLPVKLLQK